MRLLARIFYALAYLCAPCDMPGIDKWAKVDTDAAHDAYDAYCQEQA